MLKGIRDEIKPSFGKKWVFGVRVHSIWNQLVTLFHKKTTRKERETFCCLEVLLFTHIEFEFVLVEIVSR